MNSKQRNKNRVTAEWLVSLVHTAKLRAHTCENCGEKGGHWIQTAPQSLEDVMTRRADRGFWICPMYYGADGWRLPEHTDSEFIEPNLGIALFLELIRSNAEVQR